MEISAKLHEILTKQTITPQFMLSVCGFLFVFRAVFASIDTSTGSLFMTSLRHRKNFLEIKQNKYFINITQDSANFSIMQALKFAILFCAETLLKFVYVKYSTVIV